MTERKKKAKNEEKAVEEKAEIVSRSSSECNDKKCPFHGKIRTRGMVFVGNVKKTDLHRTATVEFRRQFFLQKYERREIRFSRIKAHNPICINACVGDQVKIMETRPISKTKNFVVIQVVGRK